MGKKKGGLSECSEEFEGVASFEVGVGEALDGTGVESLVGEFSAEDPRCFVRLVFKPEGLDAEAVEHAREHEGKGSDESWQIPFCVVVHGCLF